MERFLQQEKSGFCVTLLLMSQELLLIYTAGGAESLPLVEISGLPWLSNIRPRSFNVLLMFISTRHVNKSSLDVSTCDCRAVSCLIILFSSLTP